MYIANFGGSENSNKLRLNGGEKSEIENYIKKYEKMENAFVKIHDPLHKGIDGTYTCLLTITLIPEKSKSAG